MKTLIVDDVAVVRLCMKLILKQYGECTAVSNGLEAIKSFESCFLENKKYDLICLDLLMPEMDGYEVLERIRDFEKRNNIKKDCRVKVIVITGLSDPSSCQKSFSEECDLFLTKPINDEKFHKYLVGLELIKDE